MRLLFLSGGLGERLAPLTTKTPKSLIKIGEHSTLTRLLASAGDSFSEIAVAVPAANEGVKKKFQSALGNGVTYVESAATPMDTITKYITNATTPTLICWGDVFTSCNLADMAADYDPSTPNIGVIALWQTTNMRKLRHWGSVGLNSNRLTYQHNVPEYAQQGLMKTGAFLLTPSMNADIQKYAAQDNTMSHVFNSLILDKKFRGYVFEGYKININYGQDMLDAAQVLASINDPTLISPCAVIATNVTLKGVNGIGDNVCIKEGAYIENSILLGGCKIGKNATITHSIIGPNTHIQAGSSLAHKMTDGKQTKELNYAPY